MKFEILFMLLVVSVNGLRPRVSSPLLDKNASTPYEDIPQFVMLGFEESLTEMGFNDTFDHLKEYKNKANGCFIHATFFVSHDNCDYHWVRVLFDRGHEIAVNSISKTSDIEYWKSPKAEQWEAEIVGQRGFISKLAKINKTEIMGFRSPFLQTAGNVTYQTLVDAKMLYDNTLGTREYSRAPSPMYPYTLSDGLQQECLHDPCPNGKWADLWEIPLVDYWKTNTPCIVVDQCSPSPKTEDDTFNFLKDNFERHYGSGENEGKGNKAPFPIFMRESWLRIENGSAKRQGLFKFLKYLTEKPDVFIMSIQSVISWMMNPVPVKEIKDPKCEKGVETSSDCGDGHVCVYNNLPQDAPFWGGSRYMHICGSDCPSEYPWVNNWKAIVGSDDK